jgi:hypothetical protein
MPTMLVLPWLWTREPRRGNALLFASRFDSTGFRQGWRLFTGGTRLYIAVLQAPGALGASVRAHPFRGRYYTLSLWKDQQSLLAFAHDPAHARAVASMTELGPARGVLVSRDAEPRQRPAWQDTMRWLETVGQGRYQHQPGPAGPDPVAPGA